MEAGRGKRRSARSWSGRCSSARQRRGTWMTRPHLDCSLPPEFGAATVLLDAASGPERAEHCYECGLKFTSRRALHRFAQVCEVPRRVVACIFCWTKPRLVFGHTSRCARCDGTLCMQFLDQSEAGQAFSGRHSFCGQVGGVDKRKQGLVKRTGRPQCHGDSAVCVGEQLGQVAS